MKFNIKLSCNSSSSHLLTWAKLSKTGSHDWSRWKRQRGSASEALRDEHVGVLMPYRWSPTHVPPISTVHPVYTLLPRLSRTYSGASVYRAQAKITFGINPSPDIFRSTILTCSQTQQVSIRLRLSRAAGDARNIMMFIYTSGSFYLKLLTLYSDSAFDQVLHSLGIMTLALAAQRRALLVELQQHTIVHSALWTSYFTWKYECSLFE